MPELPEVETVLRGLEKIAKGRSIQGVDVYSEKLRVPIPKLKHHLINQKITTFERRAKYMILHLTNARHLIVHLGMSGSFRFYKTVEEARGAKQAHDHVLIALDNGAAIYYNDPRRFGVIDITDDIDDYRMLAHLGPEPLADSFTGKVFLDSLAGKRISIKQAIMDQKIVVGVGNIYASEALFRARINPVTPAGDITSSQARSLVKEIKFVLSDAIAHSGSTLRNYRQVGGEVGGFQERFAVYDRKGEKCPGCTCDVRKTGGIKKIVQGGRSTFYCPVKQG